jgi:hypothetical protein
MVPRDLAAREVADQGHITERMAHDLQLGAGRAEVRAADSSLMTSHTWRFSVRS